MVDPGGSFATGPSTSPVLSEPASQVAWEVPNGPAPQTGPLQSYVDAKPRTDADKVALLSSIATLGSAGKQAWVQQQAQTAATRRAAIQSMNSAAGMAGTPTGVNDALQGAFAGQAQASANQQGSLDAYNNEMNRASGDWYNRTSAAIPIMQERTSQQVNSYYAAQRLQAQRDAAALAQTQADKAAQVEIALANAKAANSRADTAATQGQTADTNLLAAQQKYGVAAGEQVDKANKAVGPALESYPGFNTGSKGNSVYWGLLGQTGATGKPLNQGEILNLIDQLYGKGGIRTDDPRVAGVDRQALVAFVNAYFQGSPPPRAATGGGLGRLAGPGSPSGPGY